MTHHHGHENYLMRILQFPEITPFMSWSMTMRLSRTIVYVWQATHPLLKIIYGFMEAYRTRNGVAAVFILNKIWRGAHNIHIDRVCLDARNAITMCDIGVRENCGVVDMDNDPGRAVCCMLTHELLLKSHLNVK